MSKEPENLVLKILREVREDLRAIKKDVRAIKTKTGEIKRLLDFMRIALEMRIGKLEEKVH